ncbi:MAG TPA: hypothetical protein P5121_22345 [Caldilineaceae bacterium]|nr:hypothetical protein [Caldilineaceae bacterium]
MLIAKQRYDWYVLKNEPLGDAGIEDGAGSESDAQSSTSATQPNGFHHLYELLLGIALIYGIAVYLIRQQAERRMAKLEGEIIELQSELLHHVSVVLYRPRVTRPALRGGERGP